MSGYLLRVLKQRTEDTSTYTNLSIPVSAHLSARDREWKKDIRVAQGVMVEKIFHAGAEVVRIDSPALDWNRHPELMLFVAIATQRNEINALGQGDCFSGPEMVESGGA
jgi:hypothetical protein